MKKIISIMLASMLTLTSIGTTVIAAEDPELADDTSTTATEVLQVTETGSKIPNTYAKMLRGERINLGYFGGSVTNGYAPANAYNEAPRQGIDCWRGQSQTWLQETYGAGKDYGATFMEINGTHTEKFHAGLGGTGIDLNLYRADRFLGLSTNEPVDLLFIEFSINDSYEKNTYEKSAFFMESCIKMIREKSPTTDIVIMLTTDHSKLKNESNGGTTLHKNARAHADVAEYYGIPWFWFGGYMYDFLVEENGGTFPESNSVLWQTYMADGCHPSPKGYTKYFEFLRDNFLIPNLDDTKGYSTEVVNYTTPATPYNATDKFLTQNASYEGNSPSRYYGQRLRTDAYMLSPGEVTNFGTSGYGYQIYNPGTANIYSHTSYMYSSNPGMSFSVKFKSKDAGFFFKGHPTQGAIQYRVDGGNWQYANMYNSGKNQNEYHLFYENLEEAEHTVDVILRKTTNGADFEFRGLFIEGDSTDYGAVLLAGAPNNAPMTELLRVPEVIDPTLLDTMYLDGATPTLYHLGVIDKDVVRYVPNTASSNIVIADCFDGKLANVTLPTFKYAVVNYFYELQPGTTEANAVGNRQQLNITQKVNNTTYPQMLPSADTIVLEGETSHKAIIDLTALCARNNLYYGYVSQFHLYPFGAMKGSDLCETELMNVESVTFYADYPFSNEYRISVPVEKEVGETAEIVDLSGKRVLPSAHNFVSVNYTATEDTTLTLVFKNLYNLSTKANDKTFTVSKTLKAGETEAVVSLEEIAKSGQCLYYENVELSADKTVTVSNVDFTVGYPYPDREFAITFDANGGNGNVPKPIYGKYGTTVNLPDSSLESENQLFLGWSTTADGSNIITNAVIPVDGMTLYAVYDDASLLTYNLNGGSGNVPSQIKVAIGKETSLMSADVTKGNSVFLGWGLSADATTVVDKITMDADGVTVYAIFKELETVYVAADGALTYNGTEYTATYTSMSDALTALGTNGGHIVFEGTFENATTIGVKNAPLYIFEGADDTAGLIFRSYGEYFACNTILKNLAFIRMTNAIEQGNDPYFYMNGHKVVFDEGFIICNYDPNAANYRGAISAIKGGLYGGKLIVKNSGTFTDNFFTGGKDNANSTGNTYMEINNGTFYGFTIGSFYFSNQPAKAYTHTGNATVVVNGGTFNSKTIKVDHSTQFPTTVTGATSVILNNGITGFSFDSKIDYVIQSAAGGTVSLAADGTDEYAPTFFIKAKNPDSKILIDGVEMNSINGEYLFMPKSKGTFNVTYSKASKVYANADGSGKLTVNGVEHIAYKTIAEAAANLDSEGGTIYFDGDQSLFEVVTVSQSFKSKNLIVTGVSDKSVMVFDQKAQPDAFGCNITIKNCKWRNDISTNSPYLRSGAYTVTIGGIDDTVEFGFTKADGTNAAFQMIVTSAGGKYVINQGVYSIVGNNYSGTGSANVIVEVNGGTIDAAALRAFLAKSGENNSVLNAHYAATINGGTFTKTVFNPESGISTINGNQIIVLNNGMADKYAFTYTGVDYVVKAPVEVKAEISDLGGAYNSGNAPTFTLTPSPDVTKIFVNEVEIQPVDGVYTYTPTETGVFTVEATVVFPELKFDASDATSGEAPSTIASATGSEVTIPTCTLAKEGKRFVGWATQAGKVNAEYTTTVTIPEGGITLYPVWRDADTLYVATKGKLTYNNVEYVADYTDLVTAISAAGENGGHFIFSGRYDCYSVFDATVNGSTVTLEGVDNTGILSANGTKAVNVKANANKLTLKNVKILRLINSADKATDFYFNGNGKSLVLDEGTNSYAEAEAGTYKIGDELDYKGYSFRSLIVNSGKTSDQLHLTAITSDSSGNRYYEIGGTAVPYSKIHLGTLDWGDATRTHTGNLTLVINGGTFGTAHSICVDYTTTKITNVTGAVSAIINNGIADTTTFTIDPKVEYVVKSGKGGTVTLAEEGSETAAPKFLVKANTGMEIYINGEKVDDNNGEYLFTPEDKGTFTVTYVAAVLHKVTFNSEDATSGEAPSEISGEEGAEVTIPTCTLAKEGKRFVGWATAAGKVNAEYTTTVTIPEGGITLYPVWRDADTLYVAASGNITYKDVEYTPDYTTIDEALTTLGTAGGKVVFTGLFDNTVSINKVNASAPLTVLEGADDNAVILLTQQTVTFAGHTSLNNVKLLKASSAGDVYLKGNAKNVVFGKGTKLYAEATAGSRTVGDEASAKGFDFANLTIEDLSVTDQLHLTGYQYATNGNRHYIVNGGTFGNNTIQIGALRFESGTDNHNDNITLTVNGGNFTQTTKIKVDKGSTALTTVTGAVSAIINNGIADTTTFTIDPKVEYVIKSGKGGMVTLAEEGSEDAAPKFLVKTTANMSILVNGTKVEAVNGEYVLTPDIGTTVVTYEKNPVKVDFKVTIGDKSPEGGTTTVDPETGFDGRAYIEIEGKSEPIYLEASGNTNTETEGSTTIMEEGTHTFKVKKPGYITYSGTITVNADGSVTMDEIPALIAGDIKNDYTDGEGDGKVDVNDFIRVLRGFAAKDDQDGKKLVQHVDLDEDGNAGVSDLAIIKRNLGSTAESYKNENK